MSRGRFRNLAISLARGDDGGMTVGADVEGTVEGGVNEWRVSQGWDYVVDRGEGAALGTVPENSHGVAAHELVT